MNVKSLSKLAIVVAVCFSASAFAADAATTAASGETKTAPIAKTAKAPMAKSMTGTVLSSDAIANTLVVKNSKSEETFTVSPTAKITLGKKEVKIADVAKDEKVTVKYQEENGAKVASAIKVSSIAAKKEAKPSSAAAAQ